MSDMSGNTASNRSLLAPVALIVLSLFLAMAFQTMQLIRDHGTLKDVLAGQESMVENSQKLRKQLEALAENTVTLAQGGDTAAQAVVENMRRQGVTLSAKGAPAPATPAPAAKQ